MIIWHENRFDCYLLEECTYCISFVHKIAELVEPPQNRLSVSRQKSVL